MTHSLEESRFDSLSRFDENERAFLGAVLARQVFGAVYSAVQYRKEAMELNRAVLCERTGRDKTGVSKLLKGPGNWTLQTLSDIANALEVDIEFAFFDRHDQTRMFTATGMHQVAAPTQFYGTPKVPTMGSLNISKWGGNRGYFFNPPTEQNVTWAHHDPGSWISGTLASANITNPSIIVGANITNAVNVGAVGTLVFDGSFFANAVGTRSSKG